jgi:hypothetical protein
MLLFRQNQLISKCVGVAKKPHGTKEIKSTASAIDMTVANSAISFAKRVIGILILQHNKFLKLWVNIFCLHFLCLFWLIVK